MFSNNHFIVHFLNETEKTKKALLDDFGADNENGASDTELEHKHLTKGAWYAIIQLLLGLIIALNLPLVVLDHPLLKQFITKLSRNYKPPCSKTARYKLIPEMERATKQDIKYELRHVEFMSITCDGWTSDSNYSYLSTI